VAALALALAASLSWGAGDFLGGLAARRLSVATVLPLTQAVGLVGIAVVVLVGGSALPGSADVLAGLGAGVAGVIGLAGLYRGMAIGAMGVVAPISATAAILPFVVGLATGDRPSALQLVGVAAAIAGVALVSREPGGADRSTARAAGVGLALVAAAGFGGFFVLLDVAADGGVAWAVLWARVAGVVLTVAAALVLRAPLTAPRSLLPLIVGIGLFDVGANVLFGLASSRGLISIVSVLAALYPVTTVVLARLVLGERMSAVQRAGGAAALAGAALITAG